MHHRHRRSCAEFDGEIAIGNAVQRVAGNGLETQQLAGDFALDRVRRARQRSAAERHAVGALAAVDQTLVIAREHFEPGHQVMAEGHWLGGLQMSEAGHDGVCLGFGQAQQTLL